jgi:exosortase
VLGAAALVLTCGWLFWDFVQRQFKMAVEHQADWGHTLVIPLIAGYFVYLQRDRILARPLKTTWFGLLVMLVGVGLYMLCTAGPLPLRHHNVQGACVALAVAGITLLFCGWHAMRWLAFPLAYMFVFSQYISERLLHTVTFAMQDITAMGAGALLSLFLDISRSGNILTIHHGGQALPLNIAEACSGMRMLMAFLALGTALAFTGLRHPWQRVLLVLLGVPTAIVVNILRVCTLGVLTLLDSGFAAGDFHSFIGLLWLVPALFIFLGLMWIIRHLVIEEDAPASRATAA